MKVIIIMWKLFLDCVYKIAENIYVNWYYVIPLVYFMTVLGYSRFNPTSVYIR